MLKRFFRKKSALSFDNFIKQIHNVKTSHFSDINLKKALLKTSSLPEKYAYIKEVIFRMTGLSLYDSQLLAAYSMQTEHIAELPTGEGKTLSAVVTAICNILEKKQVHILVFNDYLAQRDGQANRAIFEFCGFSCGFITEQSTKEERKKAYSCDVTYLAAKEAGFDFLRDFLATNKNELIFPTFDTAIIDEADSILIDEARIPLVLAGNIPDELNESVKINSIIKDLEKDDYTIDKAQNQVWLTDQGIENVETALNIDNLYSGKHEIARSLIDSALQAHHLLKKDCDYLIKDDEVFVIDESTGRIAKNRKFPDALHNAVEAKECISNKNNTIVFNSIPMQSFIKMYKSICGMTGTAKSASKEIFDMYELEVDVIAPHKPCVREDLPNYIIKDEDQQENTVIQEIENAHKKGQPVLVGTGSVAESEFYGKLLTKQNIPFCILNARNNETEAHAISRAGEIGRVTVSTNLSGRGVDIRLGGPDESDYEKVKELGGLYVIGTNINRSLRIDNQLKGRAGRQGDPGKSRYFIHLNHPVITNYFDDDEQKKLNALLDLGTKPAFKTIEKAVREAQKGEEGKDAETRYTLSRYAEILEKKRTVVSDFRLGLILNNKKTNIFKQACKENYDSLYKKVGKGVDIAEKQLTLYFINIHWAHFLNAMEQVRDGIHLLIIGRKNPLEEYRLTAVSAFDEMMENIKSDVVKSMNELEITKDGVDMDSAGLSGATTTWTYMVDDSKKQFSRFANFSDSISHSIHSASFSLPHISAKFKKHNNSEK